MWDEMIEVPLPLPFELKIIKSYVIRGDDGITLIDTGLKTEDSLRAWEQTQERYNWSFNDVKKIVLTHYHPDHYGLAGTLQELTQAPVYLSKIDFEQAQLFFSKNSMFPEMLAEFFHKNGLIDELTNKIPGLLKSYGEWVEPHPHPTFIEEGGTIYLGNRKYLIYHTPGHADGHLSFFDSERGWLIGGDFLLPRITPNISLWPGCNKNPLQTYFDTLKKMEGIPVKRVFPSHGAVFDTYQERITALREHHHKRLEKMKAFLNLKTEVTGYEVCTHIFGVNLSMHNLRFALSETLAHLEYMRVRRVIYCEEKDGVNYYYI